MDDPRYIYAMYNVKFMPYLSDLSASLSATICEYGCTLTTRTGNTCKPLFLLFSSGKEYEMARKRGNNEGSIHRLPSGRDFVNRTVGQVNETGTIGIGHTNVTMTV